jgi:hypothetical protein
MAALKKGRISGVEAIGNAFGTGEIDRIASMPKHQAEAAGRNTMPKR